MSETAGKDFGDSILVLDTTFLHPYYIKINKDSLFFLDYGVLFAEQLVSDGMVKNPYNKEEASVIKATDALVLKNNKGQQLFSPMPYFSSIFSKSFHKKVVKLNEDLFSYFNKVAKKEKRNIYLYSAPTIHNKQIISEWLLSIQKQLRSINIKNPKFTPQY